MSLVLTPEELRKIIDRQIAHEESQPQTNYERGFIQGLQWARSEICKAFGV